MITIALSIFLLFCVYILIRLTYICIVDVQECRLSKTIYPVIAGGVIALVVLVCLAIKILFIA